MFLKKLKTPLGSTGCFFFQYKRQVLPFWQRKLNKLENIVVTSLHSPTHTHSVGGRIGGLGGGSTWFQKAAAIHTCTLTAKAQLTWALVGGPEDTAAPTAELI